ncbi:hypothetical protein RF11_11752 [Thelohanellus kitauei]|uniref:Uncharacterized protein n=1 Tax=Thelohanellus kitauei TaxID=669202 RepID=A0A0C2J0B7_THEKT|nr:hypothetical protein RF11_11752 [Thelohanellus kitauei]
MNDHPVMMENLIQVTRVSVDEFGINPYESDVVTLTLTETDVEEFRVDRPFLFLLYSIKHKLYDHCHTVKIVHPVAKHISIRENNPINAIEAKKKGFVVVSILGTDD